MGAPSSWVGDSPSKEGSMAGFTEVGPSTQGREGQLLTGAGLAP